jgi:hypothetical protein
VLLYGTVGGLIVAGTVAAAVVPGMTGQVLAMLLIGVGMVGVISVIFLEVGFSEDRDRARDEASQARRPPAGPDASARRRPPPSPHPSTPHPPSSRRPAPRRPERLRGERRRLR